MNRTGIRWIAALLVWTLVLGAAFASADGGETWTCPKCGQTGNTGNFCPTCATARPEETWTCPQCGQTGNKGNFCINCGAARSEETWICPQCGQTGNKGSFCVNCGAARPDGAALPVDEQLEQIPGETNRVKICPKSVEASSYIVNKQNPSRWLPVNAADGDESTCWQFSAKSGLKGKSWLNLTTDKERTVDEIWFKNGFWAYNDKGKEQYTINARLREIRIEFLYAGEAQYRDALELTLKDECFGDWQRYTLGRHERVTAVRVAVLTTYQGSHYKNDVCLSEVMLVQQAPAAIAREPQEKKAATVYESRPEVTGANLLMKLATRSGPGTEYDEPGTFFIQSWQSVTVRVLGKSWDTRNSTWWVLVDFQNGSKSYYRIWTGLKRVDVDVAKLKEINPIGQGTVNATSKTFRGPGGKYAPAKVTISRWRDVVAYSRENGYVEVEFEQNGKWYRLWVPENVTSIDWGNDSSGYN